MASGRRTLLSLQNKQAYMRILVYFVSISLGAMTISTFFIYLLFSRSASDEIAEHSVTLMKERANIASLLLESVSTYAINWSENKEIKPYALRSVNDPYEDRLTWWRLREITKFNPFLDSVYVVNGHTDTVLSSNLGVQNVEQFWDKEVIYSLRAMDNTNPVVFLPRIIDKTLDGKKYDKSLLSIIIPFESNRSISSFVLNVDLRKVHNFAGKESNRSDNANEVNLYNAEHVLVTSNIAKPVLQLLPALPTGKEQAKGRMRQVVGGDEYLMTFVPLPFQGIKGWTMVELIPERQIFKHLNVLRNWTFAFYVAFFFALLFTIWRLSRRIYSPLEELLSDVNKQKTQLGQLSKYWKENRLASREAFLKELLLHPADKPLDALEASLREHDIALSPVSLAVVVFRIDGYMVFCANNNVRNQKLIKYAMQNIVSEDLADYRLHTASMDGDHVVAVLNVENEQRLAELTSPLTQIQAHLSHYLSMSSTIVVSSFTERCTELHESYLQALERSNERFKRGTGQLLFAERQAGATEADYIYPEELERSVLQALKLGHQEECIQQLQHFTGHIAHYSYSEISLALTHFMINLGKTLRQVRQDYRESHPWNLSHIEKKIEELETMDNVREWLISVIERTLETSPNNRSDRHAKLINEIRLLVETNIGNENLSTKFVADALGMSVPYLRPLFKEITNQSMSDYITGLRLEEVKRLLLESDKTVEEISRSAGFSALNSFYAIFKKNFGVTPAQYRKEHQKK